MFVWAALCGGVVVAILSASVLGLRWSLCATRRSLADAQAVAARRKERLTALLRAVDHDRHRAVVQWHEHAVSTLAALSTTVAVVPAPEPSTDASVLTFPIERTRGVSLRTPEPVLSGAGLRLRDEVETLRQIRRALEPDDRWPAAETLLRCAAAEHLEEAGVELSVDIDEQLTMDWMTTAFVCEFVDEALRNVVDHASASTVTVRAAVHDDGLSVEVHDDGTGFDPDLVSGGTGIETMVRMARLGGCTIHIRSVLGAGTTIAMVGAPSPFRADPVIDLTDPPIRSW